METTKYIGLALDGRLIIIRIGVSRGSTIRHVLVIAPINVVESGEIGTKVTLSTPISKSNVKRRDELNGTVSYVFSRVLWRYTGIIRIPFRYNV